MFQLTNEQIMVLYEFLLKEDSKLKLPVAVNGVLDEFRLHIIKCMNGKSFISAGHIPTPPSRTPNIIKVLGIDIPVDEDAIKNMATHNREELSQTRSTSIDVDVRRPSVDISNLLDPNTMKRHVAAIPGMKDVIAIGDEIIEGGANVKVDDVTIVADVADIKQLIEKFEVAQDIGSIKRLNLDDKLNARVVEKIQQEKTDRPESNILLDRNVSASPTEAWQQTVWEIHASVEPEVHAESLHDRDFSIDIHQQLVDGN